MMVAHMDVLSVLCLAQSALKPRYVRPTGGSWSWTIQIKVNSDLQTIYCACKTLSIKGAITESDLCVCVCAGGSPYLAAKINEAKDILDKEIRRWPAQLTSTFKTSITSCMIPALWFGSINTNINTKAATPAPGRWQKISFHDSFLHDSFLRNNVTYLISNIVNIEVCQPRVKDVDWQLFWIWV